MHHCFFCELCIELRDICNERNSSILQNLDCFPPEKPESVPAFALERVRRNTGTHFVQSRQTLRNDPLRPLQFVSSL